MNQTQNLSKNYRWHVVLMLWMICFFNYADRQAIFSVFPLLEREMDLSTVQLGMLGSAFAWIYGLAAPFAGVIVDRVKRKTAILSGLHVWSIICVLTALSRNFTHLFFFRAAEGLGETFYYPASVSMISDYHGKKTRSRALGLLQTSVYFGTIGGGFFAGLIGQYYGWRWSFVVFGGLGIVLGAILHKVLREPVRGAADQAEFAAAAHTSSKGLPVRDTFKLIFSRPTVLMLLGGFICSNFVAVVLLSWMPKFLHDKFGLGLAAAGFTATVYAQLASMAGAFLGGWAADSFAKRTVRGRILVQAGGVFAAAPFVVLCGMADTIGPVIIALTAWGLFKGFYDANIFASPFDVIPAEARGTTAGIMNCVGWLAGGGAAPIVIGLLAQQTSLGTAIAMAAAVYVIGGLFLVSGAVFFVKRDVAKLQAAQNPA
ncbi:MAG: MFS transporter [Bryobacteraceae bacterium]